ncbi:DUF3795 domain-containing protein [Maribellus comscasis]|uniref:DUF3795 domain-containing protein n=1 Tax=Maribellus comscasis TaxID=2681766 RepID=A0A6I6JSP4_9BACT|nr:DUF3795 domain-containing protein [Maribellus comscasis]QGY46036.1 DUF3795 domain-containing protein [Maribellus comscasis]
MKVMLAYCGLECSTCPIFLATLETDKSKQFEMRKTIAKECMELYNMQLQPEEITDCDGCNSDTGRIFAGCSNCNIKKCAQAKNLKSCACCPDFSCLKLEEMFALDPDAKIRLVKIHNSNKFN